MSRQRASEDRQRIKRRRLVYLSALIIVSAALSVFYIVRPEPFFERPQILFDSAWKLDLAGHYLFGILVAFGLFLLFRMVITRTWLKHLFIVLAHAGIMAWFEKAEFGFDELIQPWFPALDKLQKGNTDTILDLVAADAGLLTAYISRWLYASIFPSEALKEYLFHLAELHSTARKEAKQLALEYRKQKKEEASARRKKLLAKISGSGQNLPNGSKAGKTPNRQKPRP